MAGHDGTRHDTTVSLEGEEEENERMKGKRGKKTSETSKKDRSHRRTVQVPRALAGWPG